jgi:hypothetical protein
MGAMGIAVTVIMIIGVIGGGIAVLVSIDRDGRL